MKTALFIVLVMALPGTAPVFASADLAKAKKCLECHAVDKEVKGPSFQAIAKLYKGTDKAVVKIADKIRKGGAEHWGSNAMPSAEARGVKISEAEAKQLAQWVLTH
jgi:cytochrome c